MQIEQKIRWARWISILAHPFIMIAVMVGTCAARLSPPGEIGKNLGLVTAFVFVPIAVLTFRQVRRGNWANVDASNAHERPVLYAVGIIGILAMLGYLIIARPDSFLIRGSVVVVSMLVISAIVTRWIKLSLHVASATLAAIVLILLGSIVGWCVAVIVPFLAWSRIALCRHKLGEVVLGCLFGLLAGLAVHFL